MHIEAQLDQYTFELSMSVSDSWLAQELQFQRFTMGQSHKKYQRESKHVEARKAVITQPSAFHDKQQLKWNSHFWSCS